MKLAILSPIAWRTPPEKYGPWEQVASNVAEGMISRGIDVTVFASGDSVTSAKLSSVIPYPYAEDHSADVKVNECLHISNLMEQATNFDIIHNHYDFLPLTWSKLIPAPMVTTIHGFSSPLILPVYRKYNNNTHYVSISNSDRDPSLDYIATVYNGIDQSQFDFNDRPQMYLLFFGRIHPHKGTLEAIRIAKESSLPIILAGFIQDHQYWNEQINPLIDGELVRYVGNCGPAERNTLLGNALALLHPVSFDEPFGLSVAEAMCCGTPVVAFKRGAMPELISDGETGFLVENETQAVAAVQRIDTIRRSLCRQRVVDHFSVSKMTDDYLKVYNEILTG